MKNVHIGIAGLGTVGMGVIENIARNHEKYKKLYNADIIVQAVSARARKDRGFDVSHCTWFDDADALAQSDEIDVYIEVMGGGRHSKAHTSIVTALKKGKTVITANKALLAEEGQALAALAEENNTHIYYEAAIAGGIPAVKTLKEALAGNTVTKISGILNGTCNYILTTIENTGRAFADVLQEAQDLGYAEADPSFDVDSLDAAQKISLLAAVAFGTEPAYDSMHIESIRNGIDAKDIALASAMGLTPRLLCVAQKGSTQKDTAQNGASQKNTSQGDILLYAVPCFVEKESLFGAVKDVLNCCVFEGDGVGVLHLIGAGAGKEATASAVLSDVIDYVEGRATPVFSTPATTLKTAALRSIETHEGYYYLRFDKNDVDLLEKLRAHYDISVESHGKDSVGIVYGAEGAIKATLEGHTAVFVRIEK